MSLVNLLQGDGRDGGGYLALGLACQSVIQRGTTGPPVYFLQLITIMWTKHLLSLFIKKSNAYIFN